MQGLEATFDDLSFEGGDSPQRVLPKIVPFGVALAFAGAIGVWALYWQGSALPDAVLALWPAPTATHAISKPFADIPIDANLAARTSSRVRRSDAIHGARAPCVTTRCGRRSSRRPARQPQRHRKTVRMGA